MPCLAHTPHPVRGGPAQECLDPGTLLVKVDVEHVVSPAGSHALAGLLRVVPPPLGSALGAGGRHTRRSLRMEPGGAGAGADQAHAAGEPAAAGTTGTGLATTALALEKKSKPEPRPSHRSGLDITPGYRALCAVRCGAWPAAVRVRTHARARARARTRTRLASQRHRPFLTSLVISSARPAVTGCIRGVDTTPTSATRAPAQTRRVPAAAACAWVATP